jgi:hypothetical protein
MKKIILTVFAATSLLLYSTPAFAFSLSVGVPLSLECETTCEMDSLSGYFLGVQLPFALGLGMDSIKYKPKASTMSGVLDLYNIFYQLPIPVINLIFGLGVGSESYEGDGSEDWEDGTANQWYTSIGFPIMPLFDFHVSYRSITTKDAKYKPSGSKSQSSTATVMGAGLAFNF